MRNLILALTVAVLATTARAEVETDGTITPPKPFTLIHVRYANQPSPFEGWIDRPMTTDWAKWIQRSNVTEMSPGDPRMREHHAYILSRIEQLPALAMLDATGGTYCVLSGSTQPTSELELARKIDTAVANVQQAARDASETAMIQTVPRESLARYQRGPNPWQGPSPTRNSDWNFNANQNNGGSLFNPQIDVNGGVGIEDQTRRDMLVLVMAICGTALAVAYMVCRAITDDDRDEVEA